MTDPSNSLALQPDTLSPLVVTRLAKLQNKGVSRWTVSVQSRPGQALVLLEDGLAIVCDNLTYRTTEFDAFSRVSFTDDTHASVRLPLRTVEVEFANAAQALQFGTEATVRAERELTARAEREAVARADREAAARAEKEAAARAEKEAAARAETVPPGVQNVDGPLPTTPTSGTHIEPMREQQEIQGDRSRAQSMRMAGLVVFAIGAVLAKIGTTSMGMFVFYIVLALAGAGLAAFGESQYRKTMG